LQLLGDHEILATGMLRVPNERLPLRNSTAVQLQAMDYKSAVSVI